MTQSARDAEHAADKAELEKANGRIGELRYTLMRHWAELVALDKSRKHTSDTLRRWIAELNDAIAADDKARGAREANK